jgi:thioredoxin-related protein
MRKIILFILIVYTGNQIFSQQYSITGKITGFKDNTKFYLRDLDSDSDIDSAVIKNNYFVLKGSFGQSPKSLRLYSDNYYCSLLIGNDNVIVKGDTSDFPWDIKISGSRIQDARNALDNIVRPYNKRRDSLYAISSKLMQLQGDSIENVQKKIWSEIYKIDSTTTLKKKNFISKNRNSFAALQELFWLKYSFSKDSISAIYNSLNPFYKESSYGQRIARYLRVGDILKQGDSFWDFEAQDQQGNQHKLSDFKGKYILLDFSTTDCGPCVLAVKELKLLSEQLKDQLTIISFSGDANKETWMRGIKRDKPFWPSLWDGKGYYGETIIKYGVQGYPTFHLIDPQGKIVLNWTGYDNGLIGNMITKKINSL